MEIPETIRDDLVTHMARQVDDEAVLAERLLCGAGLQLGQIDVARGELPENAVQASRVIGPLETDDARLVVPRGRRDAVWATRTNRVWFSGWSSTSSATITRPYRSAASLGAMAASPAAPDSAQYPRGIRRGEVGRPFALLWAAPRPQTLLAGGECVGGYEETVWMSTSPVPNRP